MNTPSKLLALVLFTFALDLALAHEGHRALPTRGMEVNAEQGTLMLTRSARSTLDVQTVEISKQPITHTIATYGALAAPWNQHAFVTSPLSGRIVSLNVKAGEAVHQGQLLAELECPALEQLQMELRTAKIQAELSEQLVQSIAEASRSGAIPGIRFIEAQSELKQAQAALEISSAKWRGLQLPPSQLDAILKNPRTEHRQQLALTSPIDGIITHTDLSVGTSVIEKEHLLEVIDLSAVWLKINVLEKDISNVHVGQLVEFKLASVPNKTVSAVIDVIDRFLDPQTQLATAWATISSRSNPDLQLLPGMSGKVQIHSVQPEPRLVLPAEAVIRDGAERFVLVEQESTIARSTYQKQSVVLGKRAGNVLEVRGGTLFPGDRIVTRGSHELGGYFTKGTLTISPETASDIGLLVQPSTVQSIAQIVSIDGVVDLPPARRAVASAQINGVIERILVDRGQAVRRGDVLAEVNSQAFQDLQLSLLRAEFDAKLGQTTVENLRLARSGVSERQLLEAESQLSQTRSQRDNLMRQLKLAGLNDTQLSELLQSQKLLPNLPVLATIDGFIVGLDKFLGNAVRPEDPIFEIHDLSQAWIQGFIGERDFPKVQLGQPVRCRFVAMPDEVVSGRIVRSGQQLTENDRTLSVWIELDTMPQTPLLHNMLARITIDCGAAYSGLAVPRSAVVREGSHNYVFVQKADRLFERRLIAVGPADDRCVAIREGLRDGELVAVQGTAELQSGYAALK